MASSGAFDVVGQAADRVEAVRTAEESRPDVIVMDVMMPEMLGVEPGGVAGLLTALDEGLADVVGVLAALGPGGACWRTPRRSVTTLATWGIDTSFR